MLSLLQSKSFIHSVAPTFLVAALLPASVRSKEIATSPGLEKPASASPWGFNLSTYLWLPGINGNFTSGSHSGSIDATFVDIVDKSLTGS
jgi:hypothetical protein